MTARRPRPMDLPAALDQNGGGPLPPRQPDPIRRRLRAAPLIPRYERPVLHP